MPPDRPNVVLINTDQQRFDTIGALGFEHIDTPNLDRLVEEGVAFTECHITAPLCVPSRASLFTGYYPHTTGIFSNDDEWRHSWIQLLAAAGYYCVNVGKMHTNPYEVPMGFDERYVVENKDRYHAGRRPLPGGRFYWDEWDKALQARGLVKPQRDLYRRYEDYEERLGAFEWPLPEDAHPDVFVGDLATRWLDLKPQPAEPLFLEVGFPGPHPPFDPVERYAEEYLGRDLPEPAVTEADLANQPPPLRARRESDRDSDSLVHQVDPPAEARHRQRAYYYANVAMIDEQVGEIVDALERNGYDDTVVLFTSDHGEAMGDHGQSQKGTMYDCVTNVPLIAWAPDHFEGGRTVDGLCQLMDIGPTLLELAGVDVPAQFEAESLLPALRGEEWAGRGYVYAEQPPQTMVRSEDWKLVHFRDEEYGQLFDLHADPDELVDRWDDPDAAEKRRELLEQLREWHVGSGFDVQDWAKPYREAAPGERG
jgi:arylsulfatase A-like enzyme